jgi:hypothetical protein
MWAKIDILWERLVSLKPYFTFATFVQAAFAWIFGSLPPLSLLKKILIIWGWKVELASVPRILLTEYDRLRSAVFGNLFDIIRQFVIPIPQWLTHFLSTWVVDIVVLYILIAASMVRGSILNRRSDRIRLMEEPEQFRASLRSAAELHGNRSPEKLVAVVEAGLGKGLKSWFVFQVRTWSSAIRWPITIKRNVIQLWRGTASDLAVRLVTIWAAMLICALLGLACYLLISRITYNGPLAY